MHMKTPGTARKLCKQDTDQLLVLILKISLISHQRYELCHEKTVFCLCKNKDAAAPLFNSFCYTDSTIHPLLKPKT